MTAKANSMPMQLRLRKTQLQKPLKDSCPELRQNGTGGTQLFDRGGLCPSEFEPFDFRSMKE
jgi:hypothetical protein